ncbi:MAG: alpha/beta fold hydrolase [Oscillospiraceae bacterium]|nr:alpha/beta fold hydrolase [Oscillospiraceae bacterium]
MRTEAFEFNGYGGRSLPALLWLPEDEPKAVLQIAHGMTEHIGRYEALARKLTERGYAAAGFDLRGHGKNAGDPDVASFGEGGWEASIEDMRRFFDLLAEQFPCPHYMLGFSLGSFLLREYLGRYPEGVAGAAILGTGWQPGAVLSVMQAIVKTQIKKASFDGTTELVQQLSFGGYNRSFQPNRTTADWLCADKEQLDAYLADPLCRKSISAGLFWQLLGSMKRTGGRNACFGWDKDTPVLLLSGQDDPVGDRGKGVRAVRQQMEKAGIRSVKLQLLPGCRHDLLHESSGDAAARILLDWMEQTRT